MPATDATKKLPPPRPISDPNSQMFWAELNSERLCVQKCLECGLYQFPSLETCRHCSGALEWTPVSGDGTLHSFIVQHHFISPGFDAKRPYVIGLVALAEAANLRLPAEIEVATDDPRLSVGVRLCLEIRDLPGVNQKIPVFRIAD